MQGMEWGYTNKKGDKDMKGNGWIITRRGRVRSIMRMETILWDSLEII